MQDKDAIVEKSSRALRPGHSKTRSLIIMFKLLMLFYSQYSSVVAKQSVQFPGHAMCHKSITRVSFQSKPHISFANLHP
eukprot:309508-Amphidinium_carterae.1